MQIYGVASVIPEQHIKMLAESARETMERVAFEVFTNGTDVVYTTDPQDETGELYICGAICTGRKAAASDPFAQRTCPYFEVHQRPLKARVRNFYEPRQIDQQVEAEVKRLPGSKAYNQMWGLDDDPEEWQDE